MSEPLEVTVEELETHRRIEEALRAGRVVMPFASPAQPGTDACIGCEVVGKGIAAFDVDCPVHGEAYRATLPPAQPGTDAALRELRWWHDHAHMDAPWDECEVCGIIRAALTPPPSDSTLDVERKGFIGSGKSLWGSNPNRDERMRTGADHGDFFVGSGLCKTCMQPYPCIGSDLPLATIPEGAPDHDAGWPLDEFGNPAYTEGAPDA